MGEEKVKHVNAGHRDRMRRRFREESLDNFADHEILEMLLYYCIPRRDTNGLAHRLLDAFDGSFSAVLDASCEELMQIAGLSENTAVLFSMLPQVFRRYRESMEMHNCPKLCDDAAAGAYFIPKYIGRIKETAMMVCLDSQCRVLSTQILTEGTVDSTSVSIRRIAEIALRYNAFGVMLAHNHPGGQPLPSRADIVLTQEIARGLEVLSIHLVDHIIIAGENYASMSKHRMFHQNF